MQVIYGPNEAGKSTVMSFIHSILFGFPTRQQSALRYEPKKYSSYGGRIVLQTKQFGEVTVERVKGKATGDVTVILEDGTIKDEPFLFEHILRKIDRTMYENIFSFNLHGIQEVHRLRKDHIGKYLVAAGTIGTDVLLQVNDHFEKQLEHRFKPGGRIPQLNVRLKEVRQSESELNEAKKENAFYKQLQTELLTIRQEIESYEQKLHEEHVDKQNNKRLLKQWPLLMEIKQTKQRLNELVSIDFPTDGLDRYEKYVDQKIQVSSKLKAIEERMMETRKQMESHALNPKFDPLQVERLVSQWSHYERLREEEVRLQQLIAEGEERNRTIIRELHFSENDLQQIQSFNLGIDMKGKMKQLIQYFLQIEAKLVETKRQRINEQDKHNRLEQTCAAIEEQLVDEQTFKLWKEEYDNIRAIQLLKEERKLLTEEIERLEQQSRLDKNEADRRTKQTVLYTGAFTIITIALLVWSMISGQWMLTTFAVAALLFASFNLKVRQQQNKKETENDLLHLSRTRLNNIDSLIAKGEQTSNQTVFRYEQQAKLRDEWKHTFSQLQLKSEQIEQLLGQQEQLQQQLEQVDGQLAHLKAQMGLDIHFANERIEDAFYLLKELQQLSAKLTSRKERLALIKKQQEQFISSLDLIADTLEMTDHDPQEMIFILKKMQTTERDKKMILHEQSKRLTELEDELVLLRKEHSELTDIIHRLFQQAGVENEEDFRQKGQQFAKKNRLQERLLLLESQEDRSLRERFNRVQFESKVREQLAQNDQFIDSLTTKLNELRNKRVEIQHEIQRLERGGTFTEKLHRFHHVQSLFQEEAAEWATIALAKTLLQQTMDRYKRDRLPRVIKQANDYFSFLTSKAYKQIHIQPEGKLYIERKDGLLFDPGELSQGTAEQLYIAIRFALVNELYHDYPFPLIIDDGFVNFDAQRTERVIQLIHHLKDKNQMIFFTCHSHIFSHFKDKCIYNLFHEKKFVMK